MIKLEDASMIAVARGRVDSVRWNFLIGVWFAVGAALTLNSTAAGLSWCLVLTLALAFDHVLGRSYLSAHAKERATAGWLFFWSCLFSISLIPAMAILLAVNGGGPGRVLGALMAASSVLRVT